MKRAEASVNYAAFTLLSYRKVAKLAALHYEQHRRDLKEGQAMMKIVSRAILTAAAVSMAALPIAAQAKTRAGDSGSIYTASAPGLGRADEGEEFAAGFPLIVAIVVAATVVAAIATVVDNASDDDEELSPGA